MSKLSIVMVGGDQATAAEGIPIAEALRQRSHSVRWIMDSAGEGRKRLDSQQVSYEVHQSDLLTDHVDFVLVLTSATATAAQVEWTKFCLEKNIPVGWYEDYAGTANVEAVRELQPTLIMVINHAAADIAYRIRPNVPVHVVGKPSFEPRAKVIKDPEDYRQAGRSKLHLKEDDFVVVYWSGGEILNRVEQQLACLRNVRMDYCRLLLAPRIHPKLERFGAGAKERLLSFACSGIAETVDCQSLDADEVNAAADVVVSDAGCTEGLVSCLMGIPTIITRFPDDYVRQVTRGFPGGVPMMVGCGAVLSAESGPQLVYLLNLLSLMWERRGTWYLFLNMCYGQSEPLDTLLESGAAGRIADVIEEAAS